MGGDQRQGGVKMLSLKRYIDCKSNRFFWRNFLKKNKDTRIKRTIKSIIKEIDKKILDCDIEITRYDVKRRMRVLKDEMRILRNKIKELNIEIELIKRRESFNNTALYQKKANLEKKLQNKLSTFEYVKKYYKEITTPPARHNKPTYKQESLF